MRITCTLFNAHKIIKTGYIPPVLLVSINGSEFELFFYFFQLTSEATYEPIVFLKQPYQLRGNISFGTRNKTTKTLLENSSEISFQVFADVLDSTKTAYNEISDTPHCPREVLKFSPPPQNKRCDQCVFRELTTLHDYGFNVTFHNVSLTC